MPLFGGELVAELQRDFRDGAGAVLETYVEAVRGDSSVPRDTGRLAEGIAFVGQQNRSGGGQFASGFGDAAFAGDEITVELTSTARSDEGADYGAILDSSTGQEIRPVTKKALANVATGWGPYAVAHLSTKHVGWWDAANDESYWIAAAAELARFGL